MKGKTFFFFLKSYFVLYTNSGQMLQMQTISCHTLLLEMCVCVCVCVCVCSGVPREVGLGCLKPPWNSEVLTKANRIVNWAENVQCSYSNILINLKIAEFRTPTSQDVRKKGSKILKLPRFALVLHLEWKINWLSS